MAGSHFTLFILFTRGCLLIRLLLLLLFFFTVQDIPVRNEKRQRVETTGITVLKFGKLVRTKTSLSLEL